MGVSVHVGSFNIGTAAAGNTVSVTCTDQASSNFRPKLLILSWTGRTSSATAAGSATHLRGQGLVVDHATSGIKQYAFGTRDADAAGTSNTDSNARADAAVIQMGDGSITGRASVTNFGSTGFTLTIDVAFTIDLRVDVFAVGGTDITDVDCGVLTAASGDVSVTVDGSWQPSIVMFAAAAQVTTLNTAVGTTRSTFGAADGTNQGVIFANAADGSANGSTSAYGYDAQCTFSNASTRATFSSMNSNGFTINYAGVISTSSRVGWIAIKGGSWAVRNFTTKTDTVTTTGVSGLTFTPIGALFASVCVAKHTVDTPAAHDEWSIGFANSAGTQRVSQASSRDGNTTMFVQTAHAESGSIYKNVNPTTDALEGDMQVQSWDSGGVTCIMTDADPGAAFVLCVLVGPSATGRTTKNTRSHPLGVRSGMGFRMAA